MNIAIYTYDFNWAGGVDLLHLIVKGVLAQKKRDVKIYLLIHNPNLIVQKKRSAYQKLKIGLKKSIIALKKLKVNNQQELDSKSDQKIKDTFNQFEYLHQVFKHENVEIVYFNQHIKDSLNNVLSNFSVDIILPVLNSDHLYHIKHLKIGYIFDFVYKYLPHLFTPQFCLETDINFSKTLLRNRSIIVNSIQAKNDIMKFYPYVDNIIYSMPFSPFISTELLNEAKKKEFVLDTFNLTRPFFIICNQFWLHKSHETAFDALRILKDKFKMYDIDIVCTGRMTDLTGSNDRRDYLYDYVNKLGITENVHFLGHIDKIDQISLMLKSIALIQPTQFEGGPGGGSVYQALAAGVRCIVSDIPVNREITDEPFVTFFKLNDSEDLADKLSSFILDNSHYNQNSLDDLDRRNKERLVHLGDVLINAICSSIKASNS